MHFEGIVEIDAPQDQVWDFLTDPEAVSQCAPGLRSLEIVEPDQKFKVVVAVGFGAVKTTFTTNVEWAELQPKDKATIKARGKAPGSAVEAEAQMLLAPNDAEGTTVTWTAEVVVLGSIASLAARLMGSVTQKLTNDFFTCMKAKIEE